MNKFATLVKLFEFKEVTFYSVLIDGDTTPLGMKFLNVHTGHRHLPVLMAYVQEIGDKRGASHYFFREEKSAVALPPPRDVRHDDCVLRWYCMRMSPSAVVMFNGGEKTARTAQQCPNVKEHFLLANLLAIKIWEAFDGDFIRLDANDKLDVDADLVIKIE